VGVHGQRSGLWAWPFKASHYATHHCIFFQATTLTISHYGYRSPSLVWGLNEIIGATHAIEGSAYWIALVVSWMQTLGSQPVMPKISRSLGLEAWLNPKESTYGCFTIQFGTTFIPFMLN
jgi:hypothetical protein